MKTSKTLTATIATKRALLSALEYLAKDAESAQERIRNTYEATGEEEHAKDWKTGELRYDEEGNAIMRPVYADRVREMEELNEEERAEYDAYTAIIDHLWKLI